MYSDCTGWLSIVGSADGIVGSSSTGWRDLEWVFLDVLCLEGAICAALIP